MTQAVSSARTGPMPTGGRWGWYQDHEGRQYRRVSKLVKYCETDTYNLDQWMKRQVAEGLAIRNDLVLAVKAMGRPDPLTGWSKQDKEKLDSIIRDAMSAAKQADGARSGTAMHDLTERLDRGEGIEDVVRGLPAGPAQTLRAYDFLRRENGWRSIDVERTVVCDELETAGTFDRVDLVPGLAALLGPGECQYGAACPRAELHTGVTPEDELPVVVDVKTEKAPWLNGLHIGPQLAIYSRAKRMWRPTGGMVALLDSDGKVKTYPNSGDVIMVPDGEYVPAPCVRQDVAIVVHLLDGDANPLFVNLAEGWEAAQAAYAQLLREQRAKRDLGRAGAWFVPVPNVKRPAVAQLITEQAVAAQYANPSRPPAVPPLSEGERTGAGHVAVRGADGLVRWESEQPAGQLDETDSQAISAIWAALDLTMIGNVWDVYTGLGRTWGGRVAEAADARRRQIDCPQRTLHTGSGKCACGWVAGLPA